MRSLSWRSILMAIALIFLVVAVIAWGMTIYGWLTTDNPQFEPLNVLLGAIIPSVFSFISFLASRKASPEATENTEGDSNIQSRNRKRLLDKVRVYWVEGVLNKSLYAEARIELGIEEKPDAVENPWDVILHIPDQPNRILPRGTKSIEIFDVMAGELLILGEPGGGKSTMLYELARDLIHRAEIDDSQPIPAILNLSSWATERKPLHEWLADEVNTRYQVSRQVVMTWIKWNSLILLLDGLDELGTENRAACVDAINTFRTNHMMKLVVCSRTQDYELLKLKLQLQGAVVLQALTLEQVDAYLARFGGKLNDLRAMIQQQTWMQELIRDPLMLGIAIFAYRNLPPEEKGLTFPITFPVSLGIGAYRKRLFAAYVERMFQRPGRTKRNDYSNEKTIHWLSWLARKMVEQQQSVFYIEGLQPTWLKRRSEKVSYYVVNIIIWFMLWNIITDNIVMGLLGGGSMGTR